MKFLAGLMGLCLVASVIHAEPPEGTKWTPIPAFTDEFEGKEQELKKWHIGKLTWKGREPGLFMDHNVVVQNGKLLLKMQAEKLVNAPAGYHDFSCSSVTSKNRVRYGYFEVRMKIGASKGASAFWFFNNTPELWKEIDVSDL